MAKLIVFEFPFDGPWGEDMAAGMAVLAQDIADEKGLIWKVWTEAQDRNTAGGVYLFQTSEDAERYIEKHSARLGQFGISNIEVRRFDINDHLSEITKAMIA